MILIKKYLLLLKKPIFKRCCFHVVVRVILPWITADSMCAMEPCPVSLLLQENIQDIYFLRQT